MNNDTLLETSGTGSPMGSGQTTPGTSSLKNTAQEAGQQVKQKAAEATNQLKTKGTEALHQVRDQAQEMAAERKSQLLDRLSHCSAASRRAAEQLRQDNDPALAGYVESLASQIDRGTDYFRERDFRGIIDDTGDFARRRPELFFGGMLLAGLVVARFLKASSRQELGSNDQPIEAWRGNDFEDERHYAGSGFSGQTPEPLTTNPGSSGTMGAGSPFATGGGVASSMNPGGPSTAGGTNPAPFDKSSPGSAGSCGC